MIGTVYDTATGRICGSIQGQPTTILANVTVERGIYAGTALDGAAWFIDPLAKTPSQRPVLQPMAGASYDLSSLPAGAKLVVTDPVGVVTEIPAQEDTLDLIGAGAWRVLSVSPFPHVDFDVEVLI